MEGLTTNITLNERLAFHDIDMKLYVLLMSSLTCTPIECLQILGLWLWLEDLGCSNTIQKILKLPTMLLKELADEALTCLRCIKDLPMSSTASAIPLTKSIIESHLSLQFLYTNRHTILPVVQALVGELCTAFLSDQFEQAIFPSAYRKSLGQARMSAQTNDVLSSLANPMGISSSSSNFVSPRNFLRKNQMAPIHVAQGSYANHTRIPFSPRNFVVRQNSLALSFPRLNIGGNPMPTRAAPTTNRVPECDRTMFLTFSKGYPVSEEEVRQHLTARLGNSVEAIYMQEVGPGQQALYARVVFLRPAFVDALLGGEEKAKYTINGKHVWMRRYAERMRRRRL